MSDNIRGSERGLPVPDPRPELKAIEARLVAVEQAAKCPEWKKLSFWISVIAVLISLFALCRG